MEDLLTPQICMDIDDTPLDVGKDASEDTDESQSDEEDEDTKVKKLLETQFKDPSQVPDKLAPFEKEAKKRVFAPGEVSVEYQRLHCTACNVHLGSAPINYFNRYIHPLLKVLVCKSCYNFYCSGEFDKDEDGSEMYCRWCGQGGKVMCCAQCAYVFCQKCVRQNLGKKTLTIIKESDDWRCFGCNPSQLINLKIICATLFDYTLEEIRLAKAFSSVERLKVDHSMCCIKTFNHYKRKREIDETYKPAADESRPHKRYKNKIIEPSKKVLGKKEEEEVVCAPDVSVLMTELIKSRFPIPNADNKLLAAALKPKPILPSPISPQPWYVPSPPAIAKTNNNTNVVRIQPPSVKVVTPTQAAVPLVTSLPVQLIPGTKQEWFDRAATVVSSITGNLTGSLDSLTGDLKVAKTVENLATIHNKLQELLSSSINSLIQVRKSLRNQFIENLNQLKFASQHNVPHQQVQNAKVIDDDDDVVIVNSEPNPKKEEVKSNNGRPYLKVRTVSQLLSVPAECITIPDEPPPQPATMPDIKEEVNTNNEKGSDNSSNTNQATVIGENGDVKKKSAIENSGEESKNKDVSVRVSTPNNEDVDGLDCDVEDHLGISVVPNLTGLSENNKDGKQGDYNSENKSDNASTDKNDNATENTSDSGGDDKSNGCVDGGKLQEECSNTEKLDSDSEKKNNEHTEPTVEGDEGNNEISNNVGLDETLLNDESSNNDDLNTENKSEQDNEKINDVVKDDSADVETNEAEINEQLSNQSKITDEENEQDKDGQAADDEKSEVDYQKEIDDLNKLNDDECKPSEQMNSDSAASDSSAVNENTPSVLQYLSELSESINESVKDDKGIKS